MTPDALILENLPLVERIARGMKRRLPASVDVDDLLQAGTVGLIGAARRWDTAKGERFDGYARYRITGAIRDFVRGSQLRRCKRAGCPAPKFCAMPLMTRENDPLDVIDRNAPRPDARIEAADDEAKMLRGLKPLAKLLVELYLFRGLTMEDAATECGRTIAWASIALKRILPDLLRRAGKAGAVNGQPRKRLGTGRKKPRTQTPRKVGKGAK